MAAAAEAVQALPAEVRAGRPRGPGGKAAGQARAGGAAGQVKNKGSALISMDWIK